MTKKIILVSNTSWSFFKFRKGLIQKLIQAGHQVFLLSPRDQHVEDLEALGASYIELTHMAAKGINPFRDYQCYRELKKLYKSIQPDIIFHYTIKPNIYGTYAAYKGRFKNIAVVTGLGFTFINKGIVPAIAKQLYKVFLAKATMIWFLNQDDKNLFIRENIVPEKKVQVLNGEGIDCDVFAPMQGTRPSSQIEFLFIGRILIDKGIREYYQAASILKSTYPNIQCSVLGYLNAENPMAVKTSDFEQWVSEGTIHYYGSSENVSSFISNSSCIVLPSYREGLSMVLLEGASMAKPLIASDIAGCKEVIDEGVNGYLVKPMDGQDLADKMKLFYLLSDQAKVEMGEQSRKKAIREFSMDIIYESYRKVIESV